MQQVDLGFVKFEATRQAVIAFVFACCFFILVLGIKVAILYKYGLISNNGLIILAILYLTIAILYGILVGYSINCMIVGKCIKLSWVFVGFYIFMTVVYFITFLNIMVTGEVPPRLKKNLRSL